MRTRILLFLLPALLCAGLMHAQSGKRKPAAPPPAPPAPQISESLYNGLTWRLVGPYRGGRSCAVAGVPGKPNLFYFGSTGGGVWRSRDGGNSWDNISDGYFGGSIGAIAVSESDPNVIYAGGGEKTVRGNVSFGYGLWRSEDAGETWKQAGLENSRHIGRVRVHPAHPDLVYAAVMGDLYQSSEERGVYRSTDGGKTWQRILFANADAGAVDLLLDPHNPRILYASTWRARRTPYDFSSGGEGSALWKSTDGGDTWTLLTGKPGMPKGTLGIIGIAASPAQPGRLWALIEAEEGGVFRSDDGGATWMRTNSDRALRQRAWYYTRIYADPRNAEKVYVLNVAYHTSTDGGRTFQAAYAPHGDHHDLWIAPEDPSRMIIGDDGGAQVTFDGGKRWSSYHNQPTAQFYRLTTDSHFPYRIYAAQQDNSTIRILHRTDGGAITERDWEPTAGGESAHLAVDPSDPEIVYGGSYGGFLTRVNHRTNETRAINVWPDNPMGYGAEGMKYRFQWNFPIFFSPHNPRRLYACSNHLHVTEDEGQSWKLLSPDLTRNDASKLGPSGGPITKDNTGVEYYGTIFAAAESRLQPGLIWTGSDDGLLHLTRDGGATWTDVTPPGAPTWVMFNSIDPDPFEPGGAYVAATSYKSGDYKPYLFRTKDYGKTWTAITGGIPAAHFTRVLRADPARRGLLYCGTESGMYLSFDDGASWRPFQLNLPTVPITDLHVRDGNLIAATQGRSIWIIDDLSPLHQALPETGAASLHLYKPLDSYRLSGSALDDEAERAGENHPGGVLVHYYLKQKPADSIAVKLRFLEAGGAPIVTYSSADERHKRLFDSLRAGCNRFVWDMRYERARDFEGMVLWWGDMRGPRALPGTYTVRLIVGNDSMDQAFVIRKDPRSQTGEAELREQFEFQLAIRDKLSETHAAIIQIRDVRAQLQQFTSRTADKDAYRELRKEARRIDSVMTSIEQALYQTKNRSGQDPLNYPIRLNNKLAHLGALTGIGDFPPTDQAQAFYAEVTAKIDAELVRWRELSAGALPAFNRALRAQEADLILLKEVK
ncbi:MAG: glycosyl hydrolase [Bacteroidia bacterium]|nr:glycosyl hydrolase [Bacteroidia bacterium]